MPRSSTTVGTEMPRIDRKPAAGRKPSAGRKPVAGLKPAARKPGKQKAALQLPQPKAPAPEKSIEYIEIDDELEADLELDDNVPAVQHSLEARKRIEILREERMLQEALTDTFDS